MLFSIRAQEGKRRILKLDYIPYIIKKRKKENVKEAT